MDFLIFLKAPFFEFLAFFDHLCPFFEQCAAVLMALLLLQSTLVNAHLLTNGKRIPFTVYLSSQQLRNVILKPPLLGILCTILHIEGAITRAVKYLIYIILKKELNLVYLSTPYRVSVDI